MKEHFNIGMKKSYNLNHFYKLLLSLILAIIIIYPILGIFSLHAVLSIILLFLIIYVLIMSITSENLSNELPSTLYPSPPHTGLDGISLNSYVAGLEKNRYY